MGKKRRGKEQGDNPDPGQEEDAAPKKARSYAGKQQSPAQGERTEEAPPSATRQSRVDPETLAYLTEVCEHYSTISDGEERELLVSNVLEEISGKEQRLASDAVTSRMLEQLLEGAPLQQLLRFFQVFCEQDSMYSLAGRWAGFAGMCTGCRRRHLQSSHPLLI